MFGMFAFSVKGLIYQVTVILFILLISWFHSALKEKNTERLRVNIFTIDIKIY